ncbi:MAG: ribonuclease HI family protein [Dermatophilaceae bacterium]
MTIIAAADGSALGNPGPTGWGWFVDAGTWASGGWAHGTNNIGELTAVLDLLRQSASTEEDLLVYCDSTYVINSITKWLPGWKRRGWVKADGKPVQNLELMKALDEAMTGRRVRFAWVKGHSGHDLNEAADRLANAAALACKEGRIPDPGPGFGGPATAPAVARPEVRGESDEAQVIDGERALLTDAVRANPLALGALLHPQWREIGASGRMWERTDALAMGPLPGPVGLDVISLERLSDDLILLLWRSTGGAGSRLRSSVWQRTSTGWQQRFHQGTPEPDA